MALTTAHKRGDTPAQRPGESLPMRTLAAVGLLGPTRRRSPQFEAVGVAADVTGPGGMDLSLRVASTIRSRFATSRSIVLPRVDGVWMGSLSDLVGTDWRSTAIGTSWLDAGASWVVAAGARLPLLGRGGLGSNDVRSLVVLVGVYPTRGPGSDGSAASFTLDDCCMSVLHETTSLLARQASVALGATGPTTWLTEREAEVLEMLTLGRSVREIAEELDRSPHTVHDHVKALHRKLHAKSRGELVALALGKRGLPSEMVEAKDPVLSEPLQ